jgi:hypothetical protein
MWWYKHGAGCVNSQSYFYSLSGLHITCSKWGTFSCKVLLMEFFTVLQSLGMVIFYENHVRKNVYHSSVRNITDKVSVLCSWVYKLNRVAFGTVRRSVH